MKAIEVIQLLIMLFFAVLFFILFKAKKHKEANDKIYEDELDKGDPITKATLQGYGFKVYETKDKMYALHPNGTSMTQVEGSEWSVEIRGTKGGWHYNVSKIIELFAFCGEHGKPIKKQG